jgi:hypothetical protein
MPNLSGIVGAAVMRALPEEPLCTPDEPRQPPAGLQGWVDAEQGGCDRHEVTHLTFNFEPTFHVIFCQPPDRPVRQMHEGNRIADDKNNVGLRRPDARSSGKSYRARQW